MKPALRLFSRSWFRRIMLTTSCALALCFCPTRAAQAQSGADKAAAEALFGQARLLMKERRFKEACAKFDASQQLDPGLGTLLYLADCYEKSDMLASAWATFEQAASIARNRGDDNRARIAAVRATALKPRLVKVVIEVAGAKPAGLEIRRNGRIIPAASYGVAIPVDTGDWMISATAPGHEPFETKVRVEQAAKKPYRVKIPALIPFKKEAAKLQAASTPVAPPVAPQEFSAPEDAGSTQRTLGWVIGGVGVVSLIASGVFTLLAASDNDDSEELCDPDDPNSCPLDAVELREDAKDQANMATIAGVVGLAGVAAGGTLLLTAPRDERGTPTGLVVRIGGTW